MPSALTASWILASARSRPSITERASSTETSLTGTSQTLPPLKSIPRFRPRPIRLATEMTDTRRAMIKPHLNKRVKSKLLVHW